MIIKVDRRIYSDECIANTVYWLGQKYTCSRAISGANEETVTIESMNIAIPDLFVENEFWSSLNDFKLRERIKEETKDIRTILYVKAFSDCDNITEEDIDEI